MPRGGHFRDLSSEEARDMQAKSLESRRKKMLTNKNLREAVRLVLSVEITDKKAREMMAKYGIADENMTSAVLISIAMVKKAASGDVGAYRALAEQEDKYMRQDSTGVQRFAETVAEILSKADQAP